MQDLHFLNHLQCSIHTLEDMYQKLGQKISALNQLLTDNIFLPDSLCESTKDQLDKIVQLQAELLASYTKLEMGDIPSGLTEINAAVDIQKKDLEEKANFYHEVTRFLHLTAKDEETKDCIEKHKEYLRKLDISAMSVEECKEALKKYQMLLDAKDMKDDMARFTAVMQLNTLFEVPLMYALNASTILEEDAEKEQSKIPEDAYAAVSTAETIENSDFDAVAMEEAPKADEPDETSEEDELEKATLWEKLGIENPEKVCFHLSDECLSHKKSDKDGKFGVKNFKNEYQRAGSSRYAMRNIFMAAVDNEQTTPAMTAAIHGNENYPEMCSKLITKGYLEQFSIEGKGSVFILSDKGRKAVTSKESAACLGIKRQKEDFALESKSYTADFVMLSILKCRVPGLMAKLAPDYDIRQTEHADAQFDFLWFCDNAMGKKRGMLFTSVITQEPEEFQKWWDDLRDNIHGIEIIIIEGATTAQAKAVSEWVAQNMGESFNGHVWYNNEEENALYDCADGTQINAAEYIRAEIEKTKKEPDAGHAQAETEVISEPVQDEKNTDESQSVKAEIMQEECGTEKTQAATKENAIVQTEISTKTTQEMQAMTTSVFPIMSTEPVYIQKQTASDEATQTTILRPELKEKYAVECTQLLSQQKFYCALAYAKVLTEKYPTTKADYLKLAYALNDPMADCRYSTDKLFELYFSGDTSDGDYCVLAAAIRDYFSNQNRYDHMIHQMQAALSSNPVLQENPALGQVLYKLMEFHVKQQRGMDFYADYRQKQREKIEKTLSDIRRDADMYYEAMVNGWIHERVSLKRLVEAKKILFAQGSDLAYYLEIVRGDRREDLPLLKLFLKETYISEDDEVAPENIHAEKVYTVMDDAWNRAAENLMMVKKNAVLMGSLRTNLYNNIKKIVSILCGYVAALESSTIELDDPSFVEYKRLKRLLQRDIQEAINFYRMKNTEEMSQKAGQEILVMTLREILDKLDGSYNTAAQKFYYIGFLQNDLVMLDNNYLPVLEEVGDIEEMSILTRIKKHAELPEKTMETRLRQIYEGQDDYGSAGLIIQYLKCISNQELDTEIDEEKLQKGAMILRADIQNWRKSFIEDLELAQSYGQIDNTMEDRRETLMQSMEQWYNWAIETENYGFFRKVLDAIRNKIKADAQVRAVDLTNNLDVYKMENPGWEKNEAAKNAVEKINERIVHQNYAAAEDLLNRLMGNDLETDTDFLEQDYLQQFLDEYQINAQKAGASGSTLKSNITKQRNKEGKSAGFLIENWPKGNNDNSESKIANLLSALGFSVEKTEMQPPVKVYNTNCNQYIVQLKRPSNGRKSNYKHPIPIFGSEAEEKGFRVVTMFGKQNASSLIDIFKEIGTARHTMVLLDYSLTMADRRELARKTKTDFSGKTYIVIDRVVMTYLANHYTATAVNRMLMAITMPFAWYQPYVAESSKVMPAEIFMGRTEELEKIESAEGVNIVYGGRQLGKSALLRMAQKDIDWNENGDRAILIDIKGLDYKQTARKVSASLYDDGILEAENITEDWDILARDIKNRLKNDSPTKIPYFLLLMDEADTFIESCESVNFRPFDALKDIQNIGTGRFKFVIAGLRNVVRFKRNIALSNNSVLTQLSSLTISPFKYKEARELLEVPLSYLGFRFPDDSKTEMLISTIFGTTNYFPGLIQLYCSKLVEAMRDDYAGYDEAETPPYVVKEDHIKKVLADATLEQQIREKFIITLKADEDDYYYLIALLAAYHYHNYKTQKGCAAKDIIEIAAGYGIKKISSMKEEAVEALMEEMLDLNVLQHVGNNRYRFARQSFCQMMGSMQKIDDDILEYAISEDM